jgi:hypothetical protein
VCSHGRWALELLRGPAASAAAGVARVLPLRAATCGAPFRLLALPHSYHALFQHLAGRRCARCRTVPVFPAVCLLCGGLVCALSACCQVRFLCV